MEYMLEGISRRHQGQRSAQRRVIYEVRRLFRDLYCKVLKIFKDGDLFGQPGPVFDCLHGEKISPYFSFHLKSIMSFSGTEVRPTSL